MTMLKAAAMLLAIVASLGLVWAGIGAGEAAFAKPCGGSKPETRKTCWRDLL